MPHPSERMTDKFPPPDEVSVAAWVGRAAYTRWARLQRYIEANYPGVFTPDWVYGGQKHGWGLRYKKSRAFCTLVPEGGRVQVLLVFGAKDRVNAEVLLPDLSPAVRTAYAEAATYHDAKWLLLPLDSDETLRDVERLLSAKRAAKPLRR